MMIKVDRSQVDEPAILTKALSDGRTETEQAIAHYTDGWDGKTSFEFKRYSEDAVKDALERLFHGKCAYCESFYAHLTPQDVEHWRPKGQVVLKNGKTRKPGYYWLAATWTNLLPSCPDCNRRRRQVDARDPSSEQSGKKDLFPVRDERSRWKRHDRPNREVPLLLDPCDDTPQDYLEVDKNGVVNEKPPAPSLNNERARQTIKVFGLNRADLVKKRREELAKLFALFDDIRNHVKWAREAQSPGLRTSILDEARKKLGKLKLERDDGQEFQLMKRKYLDEFIMDMGSTLQRLGLLVPRGD